MSFEQQTELRLMEALESDPETTQADLAARAGVAVGTVNWYIKRWSAKGYVKVKRIGRWRWRYLLTPKGMAEKADLAHRYLHASMRIYRETRAGAKATLTDILTSGYDTVTIKGDEDLADIYRLTAIELGLKIRSSELPDVPTIELSDQGKDVCWSVPQKDTEVDSAQD